MSVMFLWEVLPITGWVSLGVLLSVVIFVRYLLFSGAYHYTFFGPWARRWAYRKILRRAIDRRQFWQEVGRSALSSVIFAVAGVAMFKLWEAGKTRLYLDWDAQPMWYTLLSPFLFMFLQETYYYWIHRWMHRPSVYRWVHKWHHDSIDTTVLTAFSFHPLETTIQAVFFPIIILLLPLHVYILIGLLILMTLSATINHAGYEIYPRNFARHWLGKWLIGATHHDMHHKQARYNFGLYFTCWDRWMGTESPKFEKEFDKNTTPLSS